MAEGGSGSGGSGWNIQRKDAVYAAVLALLGGTQALETRRAPNAEVLVSRLEAVEVGLKELKDPGGPVLRETVGKVRALEGEHLEVNRALKELQDARYQDLRQGVTRESIDDLKQRLQESRDADRDLRAQFETMRNSIDALRTEIARATTARLVGPAR